MKNNIFLVTHMDEVMNEWMNEWDVFSKVNTHLTLLQIRSKIQDNNYLYKNFGLI